MSQTTKPITDFVIVTALEEEQKAVLDKLPGYQKLPPAENDVRVYYRAELSVTFVDGSTGTYYVVVVSSLDMGRVPAATVTGDAIRRWNPRYVILVGIAGGVAENGVKLGDILVPGQIADYELQKLTAEGPEIRWKVHQADPRLIIAARNFSDDSWQELMTTNRPDRGLPTRHIAPIASGDKVIATKVVLAKYSDQWPKLIGVEMEAGGVAAATFQAAQQPGFFMVRAVSDLADKRKNSVRVKKWRSYACDVAASYAIALLKSGPVVAGLLAAPTASVSSVKNQSSSNLDLESPYGAMDPESRFYIERPADDHCRKYIRKSKAASFCIYSPPQMGKSSLIHRMIHLAKKEPGKRSAFIDFEKFPKQHFANEENFLIEFCLMIGEALKIPELIDDYWQGRQSNIRKCSYYLSNYIIPETNEPFILAMDAVELMQDSPFRDDFFRMLRTWHNDRAWDENFAKMTLFFSSAIEPDLLVDDPPLSPFNVAELIRLQNFSLAEVEELNRRHQSPLNQSQVIDLMDLLGGHPFLIRLALYQLATGEIDMATLLAQATKNAGPFDSHLSHYLRPVLKEPELRQALIRINRDNTHEEDRIFDQLRGRGLIKRVGQQVMFCNTLYERYFREHLNG